MPTYEYECTKCGEVFELFQPITAAPKRHVKREEKNCDCSAPVVRRIGSGAGVIFKGSGFYQTDYRSENYRKGAKAEKEAHSDTGKETKSKDTKEPKKPTKPAKTEAATSKSS